MKKKQNFIKVKFKEDVELFGKIFYAGKEYEIRKDVYENVKDKVEVIDAN